MSQANDEVIMRSGRRRKGNTDHPAKQIITGKVITPVVNRGVAQMLHKDERANQDSRINRRPPSVGIEREKDVISQRDINLA